MRRQLPEESIVVEESARPRRSAETDEAPAPRKGSRPRAASGAAAAAPVDETLSSQTVINLDQADPVAEADFHMAYGLYDQAAELVQKALDAQPTRRDLKLKLLEVFFVWGNKDAFLAAAQSLRGEIGKAADADWDKVVIMGKQICPDEPLFAETTGAPGVVDVDLEAGGDAPLDLAFDEPADLSDVGSPRLRPRLRPRFLGQPSRAAAIDPRGNQTRGEDAWRGFARHRGTDGRGPRGCVVRDGERR